MKIAAKIAKLKHLMQIPRSFLKEGINVYSAFYDYSAASKNSGDIEWVCRELRILTHTIEKALSLPNVKKGFGKEKIQTILELLDQYIALDLFSDDRQAYDGAVNIIQKYMDNAEKYECDISYIDIEKYLKYCEKDMAENGVVDANRDSWIHSIQNVSFETFARARHSIRSFTEEAIDPETIYNIINLAQTAPSACNRQSTRIYHVKDKEKCKEIMEIQGGCKGHSVTELFLVVSDLNLYRYSSEISTPYLDGGIFLMNLLYSCNYYGVGTCPLIWNDYGGMGKKIRKIVDIPTNMHIVAVVQIGRYPDTYNYAVSQRRDTEQIYCEIL